MVKNETPEVVIDDKTYQKGDVLVRPGKQAVIVEIAKHLKSGKFVGYRADVITDGKPIPQRATLFIADLKDPKGWKLQAPKTAPQPEPKTCIDCGDPISDTQGERCEKCNRRDADEAAAIANSITPGDEQPKPVARYEYSEELDAAAKTIEELQRANADLVAENETLRAAISTGTQAAASVPDPITDTMTLGEVIDASEHPFTSDHDLLKIKREEIDGLESKLSAANAMLETLHTEHLAITQAMTDFAADPNLSLKTRVAMLRESYNMRGATIERMEDEAEEQAASLHKALEMADVANQRATAATFGEGKKEIAYRWGIQESAFEKMRNDGWYVLHIQMGEGSVGAIFEREKAADPAQVQPALAVAEADDMPEMITLQQPAIPVQPLRASVSQRVQQQQEAMLRDVRAVGQQVFRETLNQTPIRYRPLGGSLPAGGQL